MKRKIALIGVPSSAGAHWPGQEKTPQYLRSLGLAARLEAAGLEVIDYGDLPLVRFRPDKGQRHQQNLAAVVEVARGTADQVDLALRRGEIPLVIGGDCTIGLGVTAGFLRHDEGVSLLYFDGHVDLNTPATSESGILDSMGLAHMIGEPGCAAELSRIGARYPLMAADHIVLFGFNPREINDPEREILRRGRLRQYPLSAVQGSPRQRAAEALGYLEGQSQRFVVHFDVDVIDFTDMPIADVPQFSQGLMFREAMACLAVFAASPSFSGLTVTEFNADHTDLEGVHGTAFLDGLADALGGGRGAVS